ncbi:MAG: hypothetical protein ACPGVO_18825 [Spirulinaceae cyanobacterium]
MPTSPDNSEKKSKVESKNKPKWFNNDLASSIGALGGVLATAMAAFVSCQSNQLQADIATLQEDSELAAVISGLVTNLSDPALERDLALIVIRDSLAGDLDDQKQQNIYLIFNLAYRIAENELPKIKRKTSELRGILEEDNDIEEENRQDARDLVEEINRAWLALDVAESIMQQFAPDAPNESTPKIIRNHPKLNDMQKDVEKYQEAKKEVKELADRISDPNDDDSEEDTNQAQEEKLSIQANQVNSIILEEIAEENPEKSIIFPNFNNSNNESDLKLLSDKIGFDDWQFEAIGIVESPDSCISSVRSFNEEDRSLASNIQTNLNEIFGKDSKYGQFEYYDMSKWAERNSVNVPPKQLEIWFVDRSKCSKNDSTSLGNQ